MRPDPVRPSLTVIILTFNEEQHIERCVRSAQQIASTIYVMDSYSTDRTVALARSLGCHVEQHPFENQGAQLTCALDTLPIETDWVMRMDADEAVSEELAQNIRRRLERPDADVNGFMLARTVRFERKIIRHGGFPYWQLRIWRRGQASVEQRVMDEHMLLHAGRAERIPGLYVDDNLNGLTWWTDKHNQYASREALEIIRHRSRGRTAPSPRGHLVLYTALRRWAKEHVYDSMPMGYRVFALFAYRMVLRGGMLDGPAGLKFHFLQGLWYRMLVDMKVASVEQRIEHEGLSCEEAVRRELGLELSSS